MAFSLLGAPFFERLLAASRTPGTIASLVFLSDCFGYIVSVGILLFQDISTAVAPAGSNTTGNASSAASVAAVTDGAGDGGDGEELALFLRVLWGCGGAAMLLVAVGGIYFRGQLPARPHAGALLAAGVAGEAVADAGKGAREAAAATPTLGAAASAAAPSACEPSGRRSTHAAHTGLNGEATYDLVVVGAGLVGSAAARHAVCGWRASRGRIALVGPTEAPRDQWGEREAYGAHHDEGRITRCTDPDPTWAVLAQRSIARYGEIASQAGTRPFFTECGHLACAPHGSPVLEARARNAAAMGVPFEALDEGQLRERFPYLSLPPGAAAVFEPNRSGHISARRLVAAQIGAAQRMASERALRASAGGHTTASEAPAFVFDRYEQSVRAIEALEVDALGAVSRREDEPAVEPAGDSTAAAAASGPAAYRVCMHDGRELRARRVIVACGAFTNGPNTLLPAPGPTEDHLQLDLQITSTCAHEATGLIAPPQRPHHPRARAHTTHTARTAHTPTPPTRPHRPRAHTTHTARTTHTAHTAPALRLADRRCRPSAPGPSRQTVHFSLGDADAARLAGMPSIICKFPSFWAYLLPPIAYPDGRTVLKLGGARTPDEAALYGRPLPTPHDLIQWYRSGGDPVATDMMAQMLHELVPNTVPLAVSSDACANCRTPTGLPFIGAVRAGLHVATGGNGQAAKSSDEIGRMATEDALGACYMDMVMDTGGAGGAKGTVQHPPPPPPDPLLSADRFRPRCRSSS